MKIDVNFFIIPVFNSADDLKTKLNLYLSHLPKVHLVRLPESKGLMTSRQTGIDNAKYDVIVVMDSHLELAPGLYNWQNKRILKPVLLLIYLLCYFIFIEQVG